MRKRDLVLFSPLPPARNGIADYTAAFLPDLANEFRLFLVIDDAQPQPNTEVGNILRLSEYGRHEKDFSTTAHAFQLGNNPGHSYLLPYIERHSGLTTIHDLSIHHLMDHALVQGSAGDPYQELMFESYGQWGLELAREVNRRRARSEVYHTELSFLPVIVNRSKGVVTHSQLGRLRVRASGNTGPVFVIPHAYQPDATKFFGLRSVIRTRARAELGLPEHAIILMSVGFVTQAKRLDYALGALRILREAGRDCLFVVAGELRPDDYDLIQRIAYYNVSDSVIVRDFVPEGQFLTHLAAADVLINLRYPTMGETSGSLTNALAIGICAIITDIGAFSEVPDSSAVKVSIADMTEEGIAKQLLPLVDNPELREFYEANAARFARREFDHARFVQRYMNAIDQTFFAARTARTVHIGSCWHFLPKSARRNLEGCAAAFNTEADQPARLWWREMLIPRGGRGNRLIICGDDAASAESMVRAFKWASDQIKKVDLPSLVAGLNQTADVELIILLEEDIAVRGIYLFQAANTALRLGGLLIVNLVLTGPHALCDLFGGEMRDRYPYDSDRGLLSSILETNGFRIDHIADRFSEIVSQPMTERPDRLELAARATKISDVVVRHPRHIVSDYRVHRPK